MKHKVKNTWKGQLMSMSMNIHPRISVYAVGLNLKREYVSTCVRSGHWIRIDGSSMWEDVAQGHVCNPPHPVTLPGSLKIGGGASLNKYRCTTCWSFAKLIVEIGPSKLQHTCTCAHVREQGVMHTFAGGRGVKVEQIVGMKRIVWRKREDKKYTGEVQREVKWMCRESKKIALWSS